MKNNYTKIGLIVLAVLIVFSAVNSEGLKEAISGNFIVEKPFVPSTQDEGRRCPNGGVCLIGDKMACSYFDGNLTGTSTCKQSNYGRCYWDTSDCEVRGLDSSCDVGVCNYGDKVSCEELFDHIGSGYIVTGTAVCVSKTIRESKNSLPLSECYWDSSRCKITKGLPNSEEPTPIEDPGSYKPWKGFNIP